MPGEYGSPPMMSTQETETAEYPPRLHLLAKLVDSASSRLKCLNMWDGEWSGRCLTSTLGHDMHMCPAHTHTLHHIVSEGKKDIRRTRILHALWIWPFRQKDQNKQKKQQQKEHLRTLFFITFIRLFVCMLGVGHATENLWRAELVGLSSLPLPCGSGRQVWWQAPLLAEPFRWPQTGRILKEERRKGVRAGEEDK